MVGTSSSLESGTGEPSSSVCMYPLLQSRSEYSVVCTGLQVRKLPSNMRNHRGGGGVRRKPGAVRLFVSFGRKDTIRIMCEPPTTNILPCPDFASGITTPRSREGGESSFMPELSIRSETSENLFSFPVLHSKEATLLGKENRTPGAANTFFRGWWMLQGRERARTHRGLGNPPSPSLPQHPRQPPEGLP
jgi:hypothetical protein